MVKKKQKSLYVCPKHDAALVHAAQPKSRGFANLVMLIKAYDAKIIAAHDVRNPLGAITGFSEVILEELRVLDQKLLPETK